MTSSPAKHRLAYNSWAQVLTFLSVPATAPHPAPAMPPTMRAVAIHNGTGPATSLYIDENTPKPTARDSEAIVKVKAFGLNRMGG